MSFMKTALVLGGGGFIEAILPKGLKMKVSARVDIKENMNSGPMMKYVMNMYVPT